MRPSHLLFMFFVTVALPAVAAKGYHLWYDENGQAVYSQFAPGENRDSTIVKPPPPPAEPDAARERLNQRLQQLEDNRDDKQLAAQKANDENAKAEQQRKRCETARKNLAVLNGRPRQLFQTADGIRRLDEEERQKRRAEMEKIIAEECAR